MNAKRGLRALVLLVVLSISNGSKLICEYLGQSDKVTEMAAIGCDILGYMNAQPSVGGKFKYSLDNLKDVAITSLRNYNCQKTKGKVYFGLKVCSDNGFKTFDSTITDSDYQLSAESAIRYAKEAGFDGFYITLCDSTDVNYERVYPTLLATVKQTASNVSLPYGIRAFGKPDNFPFQGHDGSVEFLAVSLHNFFMGGNAYSTSIYNLTVTATDVYSFWSTKLSTTSPELYFSFNPFVPQVIGGTVRPIAPQQFCYPFSNKTDAKLIMNGVINNTVTSLKSSQYKNMFVSVVDFDDPNNFCGFGSFPMTREILKQLA